MSALAVLEDDADLRLMMSKTSREMPGEFVPCWFLPLVELMVVWSESLTRAKCNRTEVNGLILCSTLI